MKINFVVPSIGHSGGMDVVYKYAVLLTKAGHDVFIYREIKASNMHRYHSKAKNLAHQLYCSIKGFCQSRKKLNSFDKFVFELNDKSVRDADVIIATAWPTAYKVNTLSESKGRKYYFIQDYEIWDNSDVVRYSYKLPLNKIVISSWINEQLNKDLNIGPFPIIYNGIDSGVFHKVDVKKDTNQLSFLMLNHPLPKKGIDIGLKVFESISSMYLSCKLRMFGMCNRSNLPEYVEYYQNPSKEKLIELYSLTDFFIFPSLEEGWGLTPLEAMACGCLVVGTRTGFTLDFGEHRKNMMISEPGNINQMVENIEILVKNQKLCDYIHSESKELIQKLDWEKSAKKLEKLLSK